MQKDISPLEKNLGVHFKNTQLLRQALVHRSYINEHSDFELDHNERLEFLGDAVLELIVTEHLYRHFPNPEGELTNWRASLVNSQMLAEVSSTVQVSDFLYLSRGESKDSNGKARQGILANALEAIIGALYLDQGVKAAKKFIDNHILVSLARILREKSYRDPKSRFQEAAQEKLGLTPTYRLLEESGPDHDKYFKIGVYLNDDMVAEGEGSSKQEAQVSAAEQAVKVKGW